MNLSLFGANEVARMRFINTGGPKEALSSLQSELIQNARAFEFAASAVIKNSDDIHSFCRAQCMCFCRPQAIVNTSNDHENESKGISDSL